MADDKIEDFMTSLPLITSPAQHPFFLFFFFNDPPPTETYPLPLPAPLPTPNETLGLLVQLVEQLVGELQHRPRRSHHAAPGHREKRRAHTERADVAHREVCRGLQIRTGARRSEEHTSELQSQSNLVCRLLLE